MYAASIVEVAAGPTAGRLLVIGPLLSGDVREGPAVVTANGRTAHVVVLAVSLGFHRVGGPRVSRAVSGDTVAFEVEASEDLAWAVGGSISDAESRPPSRSVAC